MKSENCVVALSIPKKLVIGYFTERPDRLGRRSNAVKAVNYILHKALREQYVKIGTDEKES